MDEKQPVSNSRAQADADDARLEARKARIMSVPAPRPRCGKVNEKQSGTPDWLVPASASKPASKPSKKKK